MFGIASTVPCTGMVMALNVQPGPTRLLVLLNDGDKVAHNSKAKVGIKLITLGWEPKTTATTPS